MKDDPLSETQTLIIQLHGKFDGLKETVDRIREDTKSYPITKDQVERHAEHHKFHFKSMSELKTDVDKAKGWAAALGAAIGAIAGYFGSTFKNP